MIHLTNGEKKFDKHLGCRMLSYQIEMEIIRSRVVPWCYLKTPRDIGNNRHGGQILNDLERFAMNAQILKNQRKAREGVSQKSQKLNITIRSSGCNHISRAAYFYCNRGTVRFSRFNRQLKGKSAKTNARHTLYHAMETFFFRCYSC